MHYEGWILCRYSSINFAVLVGLSNCQLVYSNSGTNERAFLKFFTNLTVFEPINETWSKVLNFYIYFLPFLLILISD